jgi:lipopolysaccharide/colanic/teichoic acid biosynthesis glycosyltransferase
MSSVIPDRTRDPFGKRAFDIVVAALVLAVVSPLMLGIALAIRRGSPGPVLFRGRRVGRNGADFDMLKFRTMVVGSDKGATSTSADDPRVTRTGAFLRRYKLDELPQLLNVLRGEMSLVGPRPQVRWAVDLYTPEERRLLLRRPGMTDFASLKYRNEAEILRGSADPDQAYLELIAPGKIRLGLHYVDRASLWTDLTILTATGLALVGVDPSWCLPRE